MSRRVRCTYSWHLFRPNHILCGRGALFCGAPARNCFFFGFAADSRSSPCSLTLSLGGLVECVGIKVFCSPRDLVLQSASAVASRLCFQRRPGRSIFWGISVYIHPPPPGAFLSFGFRVCGLLKHARLGLGFVVVCMFSRHFFPVGFRVHV